MSQNRIVIKLKHVFVAILVTLILSLLAFNIDFFLCSCHKIKTEVFNDFGTFYGGILGTIVACFAFYFVFLTYDVQEKQFEVLKKDADFNIVSRLYDNIIQEINSIQFRQKNAAVGEDIMFTGIDALYNFDHTHRQSPNSVINHLQSILIAFEHILLLAEEKIKYKYDDQKDIMLTRIYFLYYEKIIWPVYHNLYREIRKELIEQKHPGTKELFDKYEELTKRTYKYLLSKKYVGMPSEKEILDLVLEKQ